MCDNTFPSPVRLNKIIPNVKRITSHSVCKSQQIKFAVNYFACVLSDRRIKGSCHEVGLISNKYICPQPYCIGITVRYLYSMLK